MSTPENPLNILVIEDNPPDLFLIKSMLGTLPIHIGAIHSATRISEATGILAGNHIHLVFLDLTLPDSFGIHSFLRLKPHVLHIPVIILSGISESALAAQALQQGAQDYLVKGEFKTDLLTRTIKYSIDRKNAEEKIIASEKNYRQMFYNNPFPAWIYQVDSLMILEVNDAAIHKYGYDRNEFLDLSIEDMRPAEELPALRLSVANRFQKGNHDQRIWKHRKKNGEIILVEVTFYQISYFGENAIQAQMNDVTERHRLEEEVALERMEKQQLITRAIIETQEEERKTLGAELHDNINQILATAQLYLSAGAEAPALLPELSNRSLECIVLAIQEIRKLSKNLITPFFSSAGLKESIVDMTTEIQSLRKISIHTELEVLNEHSLSDKLMLNIYRIIQEQLNNILKYAEATEVEISAQVFGEKLILIISDNGKGFDTSKHSNGIGMINIQNRAHVFDGKMEVDSAPGNGCTLRVELSIRKDEAQKAA